MRILIFLLLSLSCQIGFYLCGGSIFRNLGSSAYASEHPTFSIDYENLKKNKVAIQDNDVEMLNALKELKAEAEDFLDLPKRSVVEKNDISGIKDKHEFVSMGPYWWPDPEKPDGLPYIRKDGQTNPEVRDITDKTYLNELSNIIYKLGLTYYYTGDDRFAQNAVERLSVWFLEPSTKMNPNLKHGQYIPGRNQGRAEGVIDTRVLVPLVDGIQLLKTAPQWTPNLDSDINYWFSEFLSWLETSDLGVEASKATNNIGTAYHMQVIQLNLFLGRNAGIRSYAYRHLPDLIDNQIGMSGVQVHEVKRTNSWSYSLHNLSYWFNIANMLEHVGIDLWNMRTKNNKSLNTAFEFLLPYALGQSSWDDVQLRNVDYSNSFNNVYQLSKGKFKESVFLFFKRKKSYQQLENNFSTQIKGPQRLIYP